MSQTLASRLRYHWRWLGVFAAALILLAALSVASVGQRWEAGAVLVYLPPLFGPLGLIAIAVIDLYLGNRIRSCSLLFLALFLAGPCLRWRSHAAPYFPTRGQDRVLRTLTINRGQNYAHSLVDFTLGKELDLAALQDSLGPQAYAAKAPEWKGLPNVSRLGEFVLLSKHIITLTEVVSLTVRRKDGLVKSRVPAVRCIIDLKGQPVVVYNIHLPSPREALTGKDPRLQEERETFWFLHTALTEALIQRIESETLPVIALGDWNLPPLGPQYRRITQRLQDAHAQAGVGYGFTAPGDVQYWLAFRNPWLRLDYALASRHFRISLCQTEPPSPSQHAAIYTEFRW